MKYRVAKEGMITRMISLFKGALGDIVEHGKLEKLLIMGVEALTESEIFMKPLRNRMIFNKAFIAQLQHL